MSAVGYASMPVVPSLQGMRAVLEKQFQGPLEAASKKAGDTLAKGLTDGVEKASKDVARARKAEVDAADAVAQAEGKVAELRDKAASKAKSVEQAELALQAARLSSDGAVEKAEQSLAKLRESGTATTEELTTAERKLEQVRAAEASKVLGKENALERARQGATKATRDAEKAAADLAGKQSSLADAQDNVTAAAKRLERSQDGAEDSTSKLKMSFGDAESAASGFASKLGDLVKVGGGLAGIAGVGATFAEGFNVSNQISTMNSQLGLTGQAAAELGDEVEQVMRSGLAGSAEDAIAAVGALTSQFSYLGFEGEQTATDLSDNFLALSQTFGTDMVDATQTAGQLITNGLATDVEQAADLMTTAMQRVPAAMRDELPEIINEYGTNFASLGFSGEQAFDMLVGASAGGAIALDKTGDALKEFGIKATDLGDTGAVEALADLGLAGENIQARLLAGGDSARSAFTQITEGLVGIKDPTEQATAAVALFGTPLEDLDKAKLPAFLESLNATGEGMAGFEGASQALADGSASSLQGRLDALKGTVTVLATDGFMLVWDTIQTKVIPAFQSAGDWIQRNRDWLEPLAWIVGSVALAFGGMALATSAYTLAAGFAATATSGITKAFTFLLAHPIVAAIAAIAGGLIYFFTQTETGKKVWQTLMDALGTAWQWLKNTFGGVFTWVADIAVKAWEGIKAGWDLLWGAIQTAWNDYIKPVWDAFAGAVSWLWDSVLSPVFGFIIDYYTMLGTVMWTVWSTVIKVAWDALSAAAMWLWDSVLSPVFNAIKTGFQLVGEAFSWYWNNVIKPAWDALGAGISWVWDNVISPAWDALKAALGAVGDFFSWVWNSVIKPAWDALGAGIRWVADNVVHPVFEGLKTGLSYIETAFSKAVDFIGITWDKIKAITAAPINFVIREVYMGGLRPAWEKVANLVGLDPLPEMKEIGGFAEGTARVPGARTRQDNVQMVSTDGRFSMGLRGGEGVAVPEVVDTIGERNWNALNEAGLHGGAPAVGKVLQRMNLGGHADGGIVHLGGFNEGGVTNLAGALSEIQRSHAAFVGRFFPGLFNLTSASRSEPGSMHDFGSQSATDWQAKDGQFATQMPTPASKGLARAIATNFPNTTQLIHHPLDGWQNILNGGPFDYGPGTNAGHGNHVHWGTRSPLQFDGDDIVLSDIPGGAGGGISMASLAKTAWDKAIGLIPGFPGKDSSGLFGGVPGGFLEKSATSLWDFVKDKFKSVFSGGSGGSGGGAEQWRDLARVALQRHGYDPDPYIDAMLQQIQIESTGDPNAINDWDSNAMRGTPSAGLLQVIEPTYRDVRNRYPSAFEGLPDNRTEPLTNLVAGVGALRRDWGGPAGGRWPTKDGYDNGGYLPPTPGGFGTYFNHTSKPEPVFTNPQWTLIKSLVISTAEVLDPLRVLAKNGRDAFRHIEELAENSRRQLADGFDAAGAAVWAALPGEVQDALTVAQAVGQQWEKVSGYLGEKAIAWSKGEWPIGSGRVVEQAAGPAWLAMHLDESLEKVARSNMELAEQVIAGNVSPGNDPVANALFDIFGRDPILPDLARIAALGPNAIAAATDAAMVAFETGETARLEEWTASNSQLTEAVLRARDAAIVTGEMVQGAVNGYLNWAMASDTQGRQGSWQEYFQHYGGEYGTAQGDWMLSQVGLGGILGGKLKDSAANLLIEAARSPLLAAPAILDDDGRVIGSQLDRTPDVGQLDRSGYTELSPSASGDGAGPSPAGGEKSIVIEVQGTHVSVEELEKAVGALNGEVNGVKVEVKRMQNQTADVTAGVSLMV